MVSTLLKVLTASVVLAATFYQTFLKGFIFDSLGYGRVLSPLSTFNVHCEKVDNVGLEACEDMWLHEPSGLLYLACSKSLSRSQWFPPSDKLNASGRFSNDRFAILDTRASGPISERLRWMTTSNYDGNHGDGVLVLHGFDIKADGPSESPKLKILLNNHRPPMDPETGALLDATKLGGNSTIEIFEAVLGETTMKHIRTYSDPLIDTPNEVAWVSDDSFLFTNDHNSKVGFRRGLEVPLSSGGNVGYCDLEGCRILSSAPQAYSNGIIHGTDGLIYVAHSATGDVQVNELQLESSSLKLLDTIKIPYPIDNLAQDSNGDIFVASFPVLHKFLASTESPFDILPPTAAWRISKDGNGAYQVDKVLEDDGSVLPAATVVVHDPQTGRMFLGGELVIFNYSSG
ncbi:hypothetical protein D0Z07_8533 [Hyphodiscus hymeniophilus]|uniref:Serum paraoxonase/arylesterase n=1 Tax=Hyphodiscus hymeniophilus TaxID=353542 RepID=A0A9P6SK78_9HELO|nr:hypothetical protein D0Z07_8533 [Hyphodiscus hymeniophilus]